MDTPTERTAVGPDDAAPGSHRAGVGTHRKPLRTLLLFEKEWDRGGLAPLVQAGEVELSVEGFNLFRFPGNARLLGFDAWRTVERLCDKYRGRVGAVVSNNEQFGAVLAAVVACRLGLPGADPAALCRAHHKVAARAVQSAAVPEATIASTVLPLALDDPRAAETDALARVLGAIGRPLPAFVKPVKATFSVLARRVASPEQLAQHLHFSPFERLVIRKLVAPYAALASRLIDMPCDPTAMMLEDVVDAHQVNVDGYVHDGRVRVLGVVDAWMHPQETAGARHFLRFAYPSVVQGAARDRVLGRTRRVVAALGLRHGFFNCEFFVTADGAVKFIEINPRLASQFVGIYRDVEGFDIYRMLIALAAGRDPAEVPRLPRRMGAAASFVWRAFDGNAGPQPAPGAQRWLRERYPQAWLALYHKRGAALAREYKWLGSHRYAIVNVGARDAAALESTFEEICARFGWPCVRPDTAVSPAVAGVAPRAAA